MGIREKDRGEMPTDCKNSWILFSLQVYMQACSEYLQNEETLRINACQDNNIMLNGQATEDVIESHRQYGRRHKS